MLLILLWSLYNKTLNVCSLGKWLVLFSKTKLFPSRADIKCIILYLLFDVVHHWRLRGVATDDETQISSAPLVHCSRHNFVWSRWVVAVDGSASIPMIESALSGAKLEEILEKYGDITIGCSPLLRQHL